MTKASERLERRLLRAAPNPPKLDSDIEIARLRLNGKRLTARVEEAIISGDIERTIEAASTVTVTLKDQDRTVAHSSLFVNPKNGHLTRVDMRLDDLAFRLAGMSKMGDDFTYTFEDRIVALLREKKGVKKASRSKVTRAEFIRLLAKEVRSHPIKFYAPELHKRQPIASERDRPSRADKDENKQPGFDTGATIKVKKQKATKKQLDNIERVLDTGVSHNSSTKVLIASIATITQESVAGLEPRNGKYVGLFHQNSDPNSGWPATQVPETDAAAFFKVANRVYKGNPGISVAALSEEVQGSGNPAGYAQWVGEATDTVKAYKGDSSSARRDFQKYEFKRNKEENSWDCMARLSEDVGWRRFVVGDTLFYLSEEDLFAQRAKFRLSESEEGVDWIDYDWVHGKRVAEVTVHCRMKRYGINPGEVVVLEKSGPANGRWLVARTNQSLFSRDGTITLRKPMEDRPEPGTERTGAGGGSSGGSDPDPKLTTNGGAKGIVDQAARIAAGFDTYVGSSYRPGDTVAGGGSSDHSGNDSSRAARDIGVRGIDLLVGPPSPKLDEAVVAIGKAFGRNYGNGKKTIIDTFQWRGFRVQIIWRTPLYGGHMGHIHIGVRT